jgi:hypothetical protein
VPSAITHSIAAKGGSFRAIRRMLAGYPRAGGGSHPPPHQPPLTLFVYGVTAAILR